MSLTQIGTNPPAWELTMKVQEQGVEKDVNEMIYPLPY